MYKDCANLPGFIGHNHLQTHNSPELLPEFLSPFKSNSACVQEEGVARFVLPYAVTHDVTFAWARESRESGESAPEKTPSLNAPSILIFRRSRLQRQQFCPMNIDHTSGITLYQDNFTNKISILYPENWPYIREDLTSFGPYKFPYLSQITDLQHSVTSATSFRLEYKRSSHNTGRSNWILHRKLKYAICC